jgi:serine O-acetyltransferase
MLLREVMQEAFQNDPAIVKCVSKDIKAVWLRDPAAKNYSTPFLYFKGFHALESFRVANWLWKNRRRSLAVCLQNRISEVFGVDIHPAARIGSGILMDHATGIVIGETALVEDNVSLLHLVTLGGTGKEAGDRHPKVREGVLIGVGAKILGNIEVGQGSKVGAGSVVLSNVPPHCTVAGVPAKIVGKPKAKKPALMMDHQLPNENDTKNV